MSGHYIERDGGPEEEPDLLTWVQWYETADRQVALYRGAGCMVSTAFLAIDYRHDNGLPILYETLVFGGPLGGEGDRYSSRAQALRGHEQAVARVIAAAGH